MSPVTTPGRPRPGNGAPAPSSSTSAWSVHDASELYEISRWGNGYFSINDAGHVQAHPTKDPSAHIDIKELVDRLQLRGINAKVVRSGVIRVGDIVKKDIQV